MAITYCLVANQHCVLSEVNVTRDEKTSQLSHRLVSGLKFDADVSESRKCDGKTFSYLVEDELALVCVADSSFGQRRIILFLKQIKHLFDAQFAARARATKLKLDLHNDFGPTLKSQMETFSSPDGMEKLEKLRAEMESVKSSMQSNIGKVLERGDKVELLVDKTDSLTSHSMEFARSSRALRRKLWLQNVKMMICGGVVALILIGMIVYYVKHH